MTTREMHLLVPPVVDVEWLMEDDHADDTFDTTDYHDVVVAHSV